MIALLLLISVLNVFANKASPYTINGTYCRSYAPTECFPSTTVIDIHNTRMLINVDTDGIVVITLTEASIYNQSYVPGVCQVISGNLFNNLYNGFAAMLSEGNVDFSIGWAIAITLSNQVCAYASALVSHDINTIVNISRHEANLLFTLPSNCTASLCQ